MRILIASAAAAIVVAGAVSIAPAEIDKPQQIRGAGCVEPGVEARCLVVKDVRTGALFELFVKGVQPEMSSGIEFIGIPHRGVTTCMQGTAVDVQTWVRRDLKCTQGTAPKPKR